MEQLQGLVEHIVYHNDDNGIYCFKFDVPGQRDRCVGTMPVISEEY